MTRLARIAGKFLGMLCRHRYSWPHVKRIGDKKIGLYVVCLECGREFDYDWKRMMRKSA